MLHAGGGQHSRSLQFIQKTAVDFQLLPHLQGELLSGPSPFSLLLQRGHEAFFVHGESPLFGHVPGQVQREAVGVVQLESLVARNHGRSPRAQVSYQVIKQSQPHVQRALKALLLLGDGLQDELPPGLQLGEVRAHRLNHHFGDLAQERARKADLAAKAGGATQDHAQHIVASFVAWQHAIADQKSHCPPVVGDDPIVHDVRLALGVAVTEHLLNTIHDWGKHIGLVIGNDALQNGHQSLKAHASINVLGRQLAEDAVTILIVLYKNQVPQLKIAPAAAVHTANVMGVILKVTGLFSPVEVDFTARAAGTGVAHFPEIVLAAKIEDVVRVYVRYLSPIVSRLLVGFQLTLVILEDRDPEPVFGQAPDFGEQLPRPGDGLLFVIIAKRPIAQHLEESVMIGIVSYILQIVVLTGDPHALLSVSSPRIPPFLQSQEDVFKLIHARIGEQQRGIIARHQRGAGHYGVSLAGEEIQKRLPDLSAGH